MTQPNYLGRPTLGAEALNQPANYRSTVSSQDPTEPIAYPQDFQPQTLIGQEAATSPGPNIAKEPFSIKELAAEVAEKTGTTLFAIGLIGFLGFGGNSLQHSLKALGLEEASPFIGSDARDAYVQQYNGHVNEAQESISPMFFSLGGMAVGAGGIAIGNLLSRRKKADPALQTQKSKQV